MKFNTMPIYLLLGTILVLVITFGMNQGSSKTVKVVQPVYANNGWFGRRWFRGHGGGGHGGGGHGGGGHGGGGHGGGGHRRRVLL
jgi:uncharacterized membrane protein